MLRLPHKTTFGLMVWWCVVLMVCSCWWWCVDDDVLMVLCWGCVDDGVLWWWCVDDDVLKEEEEAAAAAGWSKKNKKPTWQCGEKSRKHIKNQNKSKRTICQLSAGMVVLLTCKSASPSHLLLRVDNIWIWHSNQGVCSRQSKAKDVRNLSSGSQFLSFLIFPIFPLGAS